MVSEFEKQVYAFTKRIPHGRVSTYAEIAHAIGNKGYQAVGNALNKNPFAPAVPCHRVVKSDGSVGGFASGTKEKERMLRLEGISVSDGKIVRFQKRLFRF